MKKGVILFINIAILVTLGACKKMESISRSESKNKDMLSSHPWDLKRMVLSGHDFPVATGTYGYYFKSDGTYSYNQSSDKRLWTLSGSILVLEGETWNVLNLTSIDLHLQTLDGKGNLFFKE